MKKYLFMFIIQFIFNNLSYSQQIGEWKVYMAYHNATQSIPAGDKVYVLSDGSLYSYNTEDTGIETYDKVNRLNDVDIVHITYSKTYKTLLIVYQNSNIDLLINDKDVYNIPDFMNKSMTKDKKLNDIFIKNQYAYLSTNFGILILDIKKKEISNSYIFSDEKKVYSSTIVNDTIYAATDQGIFTGALTDNLSDNKYWTKFNEDIFNHIVLYDNTLIGCNTSGLFKIDKVTTKSHSILNQNYSFIQVFDNKLIAGNTNSITIFDTIDSYKTINQEEYFNHLSYSKNTFWGSNGSNGLNGYKYNKEKNQLEYIARNIIPNSPRRNYFEYLSFDNGRLLVAGGAIMLDRSEYDGTIMLYENNEWVNFEEKGIEEKTGLKYKDITSVIQVPGEPQHFFATSGGEGLYEFKEKKMVKLYNESNSPLVSIFPGDPNYIRLNGLQYDSNNNLWMLSSGVKNMINIFNNNKWTALHYTELEEKTLGRRIIFDSRGWAWIIISYKKPSLFCLNTNNTLENTNDDQTRIFSSFTNQDGVVIDKPDIFSIAEDKNGVIWIGTEKGPLIVNNPSKIFDNNIYFTQIKIPRNDGTNNADFLLANENINAICIDGANRKWIGTKSGIFLLSEDGLETIHHFTTENSPLLSNNIYSIAINPNTGEVFIGTDKGLISYKSDATEGESSFSDNTSYAYPNPVHSDYDGLITITGLMKDSNVKITDTSGNLIYTGTSLGGQFSWNGKNRSNKRVASGVYFVLATNSEGKEGIVTKILMIK